MPLYCALSLKRIASTFTVDLTLRTHEQNMMMFAKISLQGYQE